MKLLKYFKTAYPIMVWELAIAEFRMKDQGTFLGFVWTLLYPLVYFIVLYGLFKKWMGHSISNFPLYLIIGIVQWGFFCTATSATITVVRNYSMLIKSIYFPKSVLVYSAVLAVLFSHLMELIILLVFWVIVGENIGLAVLFLLPLLLLNIYLVLGVAFFLAVIGVYFLDIQRIWGIVTSLGLFLTPIFYSLDVLAISKRNIILLNPMTHIITATRSVLIDNVIPEMGGLSYVIILATLLFFAGFNIFKSHEGYFAEKI